MRMKSKLIPLTKWHTIDQTIADLDIDWPRYHRETGLDCIQWIQLQERNGRCQLIIERQSSRARLTLEIFDPGMLSEYYLMWS